MIIIQALLLAVLATASQWWFSHLVTRTLLYPVWTGFLVGLIMGNPMLGMQAGAYIQLTYLGWIVAGGAMPGNLMVAGIFGTALTILSGAEATLAPTFAVTLSVIGIVMNMAYMNLNVIWTHRADRYLEEGNIRMVRVMNYLPSCILSLCIYGIPAFVMVMVGANFAGVLSMVPEWLANALNLVGAIMPALGISMLLNFLGKKKIIAFFFLGYFLTVYFALDTMAVFIFSMIIAAVMFFFMESGPKAQTVMAGAASVDDEEDDF